MHNYCIHIKWLNIILGLRKKAEELIHYDPMTPDQIEELSFCLNEYILPSNQMKSKRHALIFYTTDCRDGAIKEARELEQSLEVWDIPKNVNISYHIIFIRCSLLLE